jgi:hypothetical protein
VLVWLVTLIEVEVYYGKQLLAGEKLSLLEKRFIRTPAYQYWCRLVTVADINNGWFTSRYQ